MSSRHICSKYRAKNQIDNGEWKMENEASGWKMGGEGGKMVNKLAGIGFKEQN